MWKNNVLLDELHEVFHRKWRQKKKVDGSRKRMQFFKYMDGMSILYRLIFCKGGVGWGLTSFTLNSFASDSFTSSAFLDTSVITLPFGIPWHLLNIPSDFLWLHLWPLTARDSPFVHIYFVHVFSCEKPSSSTRMGLIRWSLQGYVTSDSVRVKGAEMDIMDKEWQRWISSEFDWLLYEYIRDGVTV